MKKLLVAALLFSGAHMTYAQASYYYYNGSQKSFTASAKVMFVKFVPSSTQASRQAAINAANVILMNGTSSGIPDMAMLKSKWISGGWWVYPCGGAPGGQNKSAPQNNGGNGNTNTQQNATNIPVMLQSRVVSSNNSNTPIKPPVTTPYLQVPKDYPPGSPCAPYYQDDSYDNFHSGMTSFQGNANVIAVSNAAVKGTDTIATAEDFYIKIKPGYSISNFSSLLTANTLTAVLAGGELGTGVYKISTNRAKSFRCVEFANTFYQTNMCDFSTPNFYYAKALNSTDPYYNTQWGLKNTGQPGYSIVGADIRVEDAWPFSIGTSVKVAVLDNGTDLSHQDLAANLLPGFDAVNGTTNGGPVGYDVHGTQVAGIIAAIQNNNIGLSGVAPGCKVIPVRVGQGTQVDIAAAAKGMKWAVDNGADIINCSWSNTPDMPNQLLDNAISYATTIGRNGKGCLIFCSTGNYDINGSKGVENLVDYPANQPSVFAVGAMVWNNQRKTITAVDFNQAWASKYGAEIDFIAPGTGVSTLMPGNNYTTNFSGTSAAAPMAAGVAALVLSANPNLTLAEARRVLEMSCNKSGTYCYAWTTAHPNGPWNIEVGYGRINAYNAVQLAMKTTNYQSTNYNIAQDQNQPDGSYNMTMVGTGCNSYPSATYSVDRYKVWKNITIPTPAPGTPYPFVYCTSNGWTAANPNEQRYWAGYNFYSNTPGLTTIQMYTYVYRAFNNQGQNMGFIPTDPSNVKFSYELIDVNSSLSLQGAKGTSMAGFGFQPDIDTTGVYPPVNKQLKITAFPNPATNSVVIGIRDMDNERLDVEIYNAMGQRIEGYTTENNFNSLNIAGYPVGVYRVIAKTKSNNYSTSFIKN